MLISRAPPSHPPSVSKRLRNVTVAAEAVIATDGDVRSEPPPTVNGSRANIEFGAELALVVVETKFVPLATDTAVQPAGKAGAVTPAKFCVNVATGTPMMIVRAKLVAPRLLLTLNVM